MKSVEGQYSCKCREHQGKGRAERKAGARLMTPELFLTLRALSNDGGLKTFFWVPYGNIFEGARADAGRKQDAIKTTFIKVLPLAS